MAVSDRQVLNELVVGGEGLVGPFVQRLIDTGELRDLEDWTQPFPARFEAQVRQLAIPCCDSLQWGLRSLQVRYSVMGGMSARFLGETLATLRWLSEPPSDRDRQRRSLQLLKRELDRTSKLYDRAAKTATPGALRDGLRARRENLIRALDALSDVAAARGIKVLSFPPDRPRMLEESIQREGGYRLFAISSEVAGHPGFLHLTPFESSDSGRVDVNLGEVVPIRLFWAVTQVELFARVVQVTADCMKWGEWFEGTFGSILDTLEPVRVEARKRADAWAAAR
jgi:hypothetical protein